MERRGTPGTFVVPIGPQHPALKEPGHFELTVDGEIVTHAAIRLGYVHRGIEKGPRIARGSSTSTSWSESAASAAHTLSTADVPGVEKLAGRCPSPDRPSGYFRRDGTHPQPPLWTGVAAHGGGATPVHVQLA